MGATETIIVSAWNRGGHHASGGGGYGLRMSKADRDRLIQRGWRTVTVVLPDGTSATASVDGKAFWSECPELRSKYIGRWMRANDLAPWPKGSPPRLELTIIAPGRFSLGRLR